MIGFGAGVGQMNAIFGLQTFCNEQVGGGKRACVEEQRSCCWPSKLRDLPASPWDNIRADGRSPAASCLNFIYNLRWRKMLFK